MASLPLACILTTPSLNLKLKNKSILFNPVIPNTCTRKKSVDEALKEIEPEVKEARKRLDDQWGMALEILLAQIKLIRRKIETHFLLEQPEIQVVEGKLPSSIKGMLIRNGPNPQFEPLEKYQWYAT
ncbi:hypothetical protein LIER_33601 [Lithospermum erythrorhizon]|uniref:Uncharacterized protein n=1 Tax=Lithospermum erythrorhizon TaxID=34254 RepID=A0AAV3RX62_LITER